MRHRVLYQVATFPKGDIQLFVFKPFSAELNMKTTSVSGLLGVIMRLLPIMENLTSRGTGLFGFSVDIIHISLQHIHEIRILVKMPAGARCVVIIFRKQNTIAMDFVFFDAVIGAFG